MTDTALTLVAKTGTQQRIKYTVTPQKNMLMSCEGLGGQLDALGKLFKALSKEDGIKVHALVAGISMGDDGTIRFEIVIAPEVNGETSGGGQREATD